MAELFRIKAVPNGYEWQDSAGSCLFYDSELDSNVWLPPGIARIDLVAHSRPARDRFRAVVAHKEDVNHVDVLVLKVRAINCSKRWGYHNLPLLMRKTSRVNLALRKARLEINRVIYLQVEY